MKKLLPVVGILVLLSACSPTKEPVQPTQTVVPTQVAKEPVATATKEVVQEPKLKTFVAEDIITNTKYSLSYSPQEWTYSTANEEKAPQLTAKNLKSCSFYTSTPMGFGGEEASDYRMSDMKFNGYPARAVYLVKTNTLESVGIDDTLGFVITSKSGDCNEAIESVLKTIRRN